LICKDKAQDIGLEFETWTESQRKPDCTIQGNFVMKHVVYGKNYRLNKVLCDVKGIALNNYVEFKFDGTVSTQWNDPSMKIGPQRPGKPGEQDTVAFVRRNALSPSTRENIEAIVSYSEVDMNATIVSTGRIPSMYLGVSIP
jgi:hypothetical protein